MYQVGKIRQGILTLLLVVIIVGCTKTNPAEEIYFHLEKAVSLETTFQEQQEPLAKIENEEYELYEQILSLSDMKEIKSLANQAKEKAMKRKSMIGKEKESINKAYEEFINISPIIEMIDDVKLKKVANEMVVVMDHRFQAYINLNKEYQNAINLDLELYKLIQQTDLTIDELEAQHEKVNASYEKIKTYKDEFNQYTTDYNDKKRNFYQIAKLDVVYK